MSENKTEIPAGESPEVTEFLEIKELWAWVSVDETGEGIIGHEAVLDGMHMIMPLVGADEDRMRSLQHLAQEVTDESGQPTRLIQFTVRTEHELLEPR